MDVHDSLSTWQLILPKDSTEYDLRKTESSVIDLARCWGKYTSKYDSSCGITTYSKLSDVTNSLSNQTQPFIDVFDQPTDISDFAGLNEQGNLIENLARDFIRV